MFNPSVLLNLGFPILLTCVLVFLLRDRLRETWPILVISTIASMLLVVLTFAISSSSAVADVEIWNGKVTAKERVHGTYEESYKCRCRMVTKYRGSGKDRTSYTEEECDTCYRTHYTVNWNCDTTVGLFRIDSADETSQSVYNLPNPQRWTSIQIGDPASRKNSYTNYVQAVPGSLFTPSSEALKTRFGSLLPAYPIHVYDFYRNDKFVLAGYSSPDAKAWNDSLALMLRDLGPQKQVNAIVVIAKTADPNYEYALRDHWEGANKNDVVLLIGSAEWPRIDFVRVISWTKNELFKVELRDRVQEIGTIQREPILVALQEQISKNFERRRMREFEYLKNEIDPPGWVLALIAVVNLAVAGGVWFLIQRNTRPRYYR